MVSSEKIIERNRKNAAAKFIDMSGKVFERLTVIERIFKKTKITHWRCICICGKETVVDGRHLRGGKIKSCGCLCLEINSERMKHNNLGYKHGFVDHPLRAIRKAMIQRCYNTQNKFYKNYGGRGISVCVEWLNSLECFIEWALNNGWDKGLSIDRVDNDKSYSPDNCEWITISKNSSKNCVLGKLAKEKCERNNASI